MTQNHSPNSSGTKANIVLAFLAFALLTALLFARQLVPTLTWVWVSISVALLAVLFVALFQNRKALRTRTAAFGLSSLVTVLLVLGIVGVINFLGQRYPLKKDLTRNQTQTLSEQSRKLVRDSKRDIEATMFVKPEERERFKSLLENYRALNPRFVVKFVDPTREPTAVKTAGVTQTNTLVLSVGQATGAPQSSKVIDPTEEKITNALTKLLSNEVKRVVCAITGHAERSFADAANREGYGSAKKALEDQGYSVKEINLVQDGKVAEDCGAIVSMGPTKAFFAPEVKAISDYLAAGGRAVFAFEPNLKGTEHAPELLEILKPWHIGAKQALVVDPVARMLGVEAAVPIVTTFSRDHSITKEFKGGQNVFFAFMRPLEAIPGAPESMKVQWLGQSTPQSWGETDFSSLVKGEVSLDGKDLKGPLMAAFAVSGKLPDSKATRETRIVVFGSAAFGANEFTRFGLNVDFFANGVSWTLEDESLISIRPKEEEAAKLELTETQGFVIRFFIYILPLLVFFGGLGVWMWRKRL